VPGASVTPLGTDLYLIDAYMHDEAERLACYLFDTPNRVLIECGPSRTIGHLYDALAAIGVDDVAVLAVTHIHLDHAGGAGHFAGRYPSAQIGVHAQGARHLIAPARLWASAERIYTPQGMLDLWGPMEPLPPERIRTLEEGDTIPLGNGRTVEIMYTPGHARHHIVFHEADSGATLIGDSVGLAFPHGHLVHPNTPPPDFDPRLVTTQLHRIAARGPAFLGFAHYGPDRDPQGTLAAAERRLWDWVRWVEAAAPLDDAAVVAALRAWVLDGYRAEGYPEHVIARYDRNTYWPMQAAGIRRWLAERDRS
jgi:glyoxylase-like metal-dependent hydrolase (beta-lactamase superfamily II)